MSIDSGDIEVIMKIIKENLRLEVNGIYMSSSNDQEVSIWLGEHFISEVTISIPDDN